MEIMHPHCCGLDVHQKIVVACVRLVGARGKVTTETRTFGTVTEDVLALADWLSECGAAHGAMESTGLYPARPPGRVGSRNTTCSSKTLNCSGLIPRT
ncbi:MAG: hypothetical protein ABSB61_05825 [Anaerolineales bacterium]|jgi:hypothetical protein